MDTFKNWMLQEESPESQSDGEAEQQQQATQKAANAWMNNPTTSDQQSHIVQNSNKPSVAREKLLKMGAKAANKAPPSVSNDTSGPMVANHIQKSLGLKDVVPAPKFLKKRMKK